MRKVALNLSILMGSLLGACAGQQPAQVTTPTSAPANCDACQSELRAAQDQLAAARASADAQRRLAEQRAAIQEMLERELAGLIETGRVRIGFRRGLLVIQLPNRVLFESGRAVVSDEGRGAITEVGEALAQVEGRRFLVSGHTDNRPIQSARFPSNWELSSARGLAVLRILTAAGVSEQSVGAGGFGEFDPLGPNDTDEGRSENRRTELVLIPNLESLVSLSR